MLYSERVETRLALEDGTVFYGKAFGSIGDNFGEVVFNTAMSGYQEVLTDPSYYGQIVAMTYPLIGNYGTNPLDVESAKIHLSGFVIRDLSKLASSWRTVEELDECLESAGVPGISDVDTRYLTRLLRTRGAMKGVISSDKSATDETLVRRALESPSLVGRSLVSSVTAPKAYGWNRTLVTEDYRETSPSASDGPKVVAFDFGIKWNILRHLRSQGFRVEVVPAGTGASEVLARKPDGVFLSNGPGDPEPVRSAIECIRTLLGQVPVFGICLGHQLLGLALGGTTSKLKFGHHGANHPVRNLVTGRIEVTSQNHGFIVDIDSLKGKGVDLTHINLNDGTLEGFRCEKRNCFSVQYHPEASPGPHDSTYLFTEFKKLMGA
jgi:carbamoyl-phosphate synthase small subunit